MNVQLQKPELERYINDQVSAGLFPTPEAVVEDALVRAMVQEQVELTDEDVAAIQESDEQIARGEMVNFDEAKKQIRRLYGKA